MDCSLPGSFCPWDFSGKNSGVGCNFILHRIFPTQGSNLCLLHGQVDSSPLSHLGSPMGLLTAFCAVWEQGSSGVEGPVWSCLLVFAHTVEVWSCPSPFFMAMDTMVHILLKCGAFPLLLQPETLLINPVSAFPVLLFYAPSIDKVHKHTTGCRTSSSPRRWSVPTGGHLHSCWQPLVFLSPWICLFRTWRVSGFTQSLCAQLLLPAWCFYCRLCCSA